MTTVKTSPSNRQLERLTLGDWLEKSLDAVARLGRGPFSIDELVGEVGVTKGSFYWHFKNREDFLEKLLTYWVEELTSKIAEGVRRLEGSPSDRLLAVAENITALHRAQYDVAMHAWAQLESRVAEAVEQAEAIRFRTVRTLFAEMGFRGDELEMRTRTFVVFYSFDLGLRNQPSERKRAQLVKSRHAMLVGPAAGGAVSPSRSRGIDTDRVRTPG